jgi:glycosyltransferase involved in cell wall biosynthesis
MPFDRHVMESKTQPFEQSTCRPLVCRLLDSTAMNLSRVPVAVWASSFEAGGTERQMVELIRGLDSETFEVHALCFAARGRWLPTVAASADSVAEFPIAGFARRATWRQVRRYSHWCRERAIQIVLTSDFYTNIFGLTGAALAGVPVRIGGRREINTDKTAAKLLLQRAAYGTAHRVVANSRAAADRLQREGVPRSRLAVVPNGIDAGDFASHRAPRPLRRALTVANLRVEKGHDVLIDAIAMHGRGLADIEFQLVGDGPCREGLERRVRDHGISHRVRFLGERHDIPQLLADADLFILPSRTEAFPNSVMEAMAAGLPVVASGVGGVLELVEHGRSGVLVPPDEPRALADAIAALASDPRRAHALGCAARETVQTRYSTGNMVAAFSDLFRAELDRRLARSIQRPAATAAAPR